jgi:hypothetical protein
MFNLKNCIKKLSSIASDPYGKIKLKNKRLINPFTKITPGYSNEWSNTRR